MCLHLAVHITLLNEASCHWPLYRCDATLWPRGLVEYDVHPTLRNSYDFMTKIYNLTMLIGLRTCVRFVRTRGMRNDIVFIIPFERPFAERGRQGNFRNRYFNHTLVGLPRNADDRTVLHELMHSIGIAGEQNREDRDTYVTINFANIMPGKEGAFKKEIFPPHPSAYPPYSLRTAMHYPLTAFSNNSRLKTITIKNSSILSSYSEHHVAYDLDRISGLYYHLYQCENVEACKHLTCLKSNYAISSRYCK